ncbi:unnamed protein product, partial [marine sediment metagenome]
TQSVDSQTGIVKFDGQLVRDLCDLFGVTEISYYSVAGKVLHMLGVVNVLRQTELQARIQKEKAKKGGRADDTKDPRVQLKRS